jgi:hypothetical protein
MAQALWALRSSVAGSKLCCSGSVAVKLRNLKIEAISLFETQAAISQTV